MLNKLILSTVTFAVLTGLAPALSATSTSETTKQAPQAALSEIAQHRSSSAEAMDALGLPDDLRREEKWVGRYKETLTELSYPEATLMFVKSTAGNRERLVYLKTEKSGYAPVPGVRVGDSLRDVKRHLPRLEQVEAYSYQQCDSWERGDCLRVTVHDNKVVQLEQMFVMD